MLKCLASTVFFLVILYETYFYELNQKNYVFFKETFRSNERIFRRGVLILALNSLIPVSTIRGVDNSSYW
jgi:hypothetical protein